MKEKIRAWRLELIEELEKEATKEYLFNVTLDKKILFDQLHKWKGSCSVLGMIDLANTLEKFEHHLSDHQNLGDSHEIFDQWIRLLVTNRPKF